MEEATFKEKYEWKAARDSWPPAEVIEEDYAEHHLPQVTAEDVLKEKWGAVYGSQFPGLPEVPTDGHAMVVYLAQQEADRQNLGATVIEGLRNLQGPEPDQCVHCDRDATTLVCDEHRLTKLMKCSEDCGEMLMQWKCPSCRSESRQRGKAQCQEHTKGAGLQCSLDEGHDSHHLFSMFRVSE